MYIFEYMLRWEFHAYLHALFENYLGKRGTWRVALQPKKGWNILTIWRGIFLCMYTWYVQRDVLQLQILWVWKVISFLDHNHLKTQASSSSTPCMYPLSWHPKKRSLSIQVLTNWRFYSLILGVVVPLHAEYTRLIVSCHMRRLNH